MDLPKHPVVHGHPVHAILSDGPVVLIPAAFVAELWDRRHPAGSPRLGVVAAAAAAVAAVAAGTVGWVDWLTIPAGHPARRPATIHGIVNSAAVLAVAAAVLGRRHRLRLLGAATIAIGVGAWIGGDLVFRHGWRVRPAEEAEIAEELLRGSKAGDAFATARREVAEFEREKTFLPPADPEPATVERR
jgi:uncharacterized membrane protein